MGNHPHDPYQSDEQMSQRSGQSILYNPQVQGPTNMIMNSNTIASSASNGSGQTNSSNMQSKSVASCPTSNGNLINHHYEDLQMNHVTGNLVPTSSITTNDYHQHSKQYGMNGMFQQPYRHINSEDASDNMKLSANNGIATSGTISSTGSHEGRAGFLETKLKKGHELGGLKRNGSGKSQTTASVMRNSFRKAMGKS